MQSHPREGPRAFCMLEVMPGLHTHHITQKNVFGSLYPPHFRKDVKKCSDFIPISLLDVRSINNVYFQITEPRHQQGLRTLDYLEALEI